MSDAAANEPLRNVVRTLLINGYGIDSFDQPSSGVWVIHIRKRDRLGAQSKAVLLLASDAPAALIQRVKAEANRYGGVSIYVTTNAQPCPDFDACYAIEDFFAVLGGEVRADRILRADLREVLVDLGHNRLPIGFIGAPDDLLEDYSKECLQFLLECPVRRYGQERKFEKRPDGLALGPRDLNFFFDSKAYGERFHPDADDIRRFTTYVNDFNSAYASFVGRISAFIVISGSFSDDREAVLEKSNDLLASCQTPLSLVSSATLADMVEVSRSAPQARRAVEWKRVFVPGVVEARRFESELVKVRKDGIIAS